MKHFRTLRATLPTLTLASTLMALALAVPAHAQNQSTITEAGAMHVTKSPTCGCCAAWVELAREEGFEVETTETADVTSQKIAAGLPGQLWSCHTAEVGGYVIEGHVPFTAIAKLLAERPAITGIAVPGMPVGSPGMGDDPSAKYDVIAFGGDAGEGEVFVKVGQ